MATDETILQLALQALHDPEARAVLEDALQEGGPNVDVNIDHPRPVFRGLRQHIGWTRGTVNVVLNDVRYSWGYETEEAWSNSFACTLAAVLLFRDWSTKPWPAVCRSMRRREVYSDFTVTIDGVPLDSVTSISFTRA